MVIDFKRGKHRLIPLMLDGKELETVDKAKVLGLTISCNLKWNNHVNESIKKSKQTPILSSPLKESPRFGGDVVNFLCTAIRPVLEYSPQIFHHALPAYLSDDIQRFQRHALSIREL